MNIFSYRVWIGIIVIVVLGVVVVQRYDSSQAAFRQDYVLPNDNFSQQTLNTMQTDLSMDNVAGAQHGHEVYMITGGLGLANPRILSWDANGNMTFGGNGGDGWSYSFTETSQSPTDWYTKAQGNGIMWTNGPEAGLEPVPWVLKHTSSGIPYYQWDMLRSQTTQYYFKKGHTYIILKIDNLMKQPPPFPQGIMSHLVPLGNPARE